MLATTMFARTARSQPAALEPAGDAEVPPTESPPVPAAVQPGPAVREPARIQIHGFATAGGFVTTANDYFGSSSRASLELSEIGINFSTEPAERLRIGVQLFAREVGGLRDAATRIDWAFFDYRWRTWLGLRAGIIKMPFGLYNEYVDIDAARLPILLPESVYPLRNRDVLLSHRGFAIYGNSPLRDGELEYQAWLGTLTIPRNALQISNATLDQVDTKYVTGGQVFWRPVESLRVGATFLRASIDFRLTLDPAFTAAVIMAGRAPPTFDGRVVVSQRPITALVGSAEYIRGDWLFAAEYSRWRTRQRSTLPALVPTTENEAENAT